VRAGRAHPALLDRVVVDYYGAQTPAASRWRRSTRPRRGCSRSAVRQVVDHAIEKAIRASDLGLSPSNDGNVVRLSLPS
jgi:ribosome recycling factor